MISEHKNKRLSSLDVFRGFTVVLMILVNSPGYNESYLWLDHSPWNGCTLADLVFPFFLFIVGVSIVFSFNNALQKGMSNISLLYKITKRTFYIFFIGLFLNAFSAHFDWEILRYYGVLQRIAICYFVAAVLFISTTTRIQSLIAIALLLGYWIIYLIYPDLSLENNPAAILDRILFTPQHLYGKAYDPEGLLSTLPAIATTLIGNSVGCYLLSAKDNMRKLKGLLQFGLISIIAGWIWSFYFPLNKALWTSSYVLWTAGLATLTLAITFWIIEIKQWKRGSGFFVLFGTNAMLAYVLHVFFLKLQARVHFTNGLEDYTLRITITKTLFSWAAPLDASLFYALSYILVWAGVLWAWQGIKGQYFIKERTAIR